MFSERGCLKFYNYAGFWGTENVRFLSEKMHKKPVFKEKMLQFSNKIKNSQFSDGFGDFITFISSYSGYLDGIAVGQEDKYNRCSDGYCDQNDNNHHSEPVFEGLTLAFYDR